MVDISKEQMRERLGNIEQIRELLFGNKIKEYEQYFENYEHRLDKIQSELSEFQTEISDRFTKIQDSISKDIRAAVDSLEKKLKYLSLTTHEETSKLQQEIKLAGQKTSHDIDSLSKTVTTKNNLLKDELSQTRDSLEKDIQNLKSQFFEELEKGLANFKEAKVSRNDLAEVLFELCLKVKGTDFVPDLQEAAENQLQTDFLLPEQKTEQHN